MSLRLSGDGQGYGCSQHGWGVFTTACEECVALSHLCRVYGVTPEELGKVIREIKEDGEEKLDSTSDFRYNGSDGLDA
jgi:hypothetical protein